MPSFNIALKEAKKLLSAARKETRAADILLDDLFSMDTLSLILYGHNEMTDDDYI